MKILNFPNLNFDVAEYQVFRWTQYAKEHSRVYAPADMKFYLIYDHKNQTEFGGHTYTQQDWVGVTSYTPEKEKITHNMHFDICGEKDDYPVVNTFGCTVYNIHNEYLVYHLEGVSPLFGEEFPITTEVPKFDHPIYIVKKAKSEDDEDTFDTALSVLFNQNVEIDMEKVRELREKIYRPYKYIRINGLSSNGEQCDCTSITIGSWCKHVDDQIFRIEREDLEFSQIDQGFDRFCKIDLSTKEEFESICQKTLNTIMLYE